MTDVRAGLFTEAGNMGWLKGNGATIFLIVVVVIVLAWASDKFPAVARVTKL